MNVEAILKACTKCGEPKGLEAFCKDEGYKDGRRSDCNDCRALRRTVQKQITPVTVPTALGYVPNPLYLQTVVEKDLPDPERLPAAYMKRVSDYWIDLVGSEEPAARIA